MTKSKTGKAEQPTAASLEEMPETNFDTARFAKGRGTEARANSLKAFAIVRGRPRKGEQAQGSKAKSLRLPDFAWAELEQRAAERKMSVHRLLRVLVAEYLYTQTWGERRDERKQQSTAKEFKGKPRVRPAFKGKARVRRRVHNAA